MAMAAWAANALIRSTSPSPKLERSWWFSACMTPTRRPSRVVTGTVRMLWVW